MTIKDDPYASGDIKTTGDRPRPLDELLKLDTYQDMTDDEIRLVIAYKEYTAMKRNEIEHARELAEARDQASRDVYTKQAQTAMDNFNAAMSLRAQFEVVGR